jgi:AraC-like DNA-binding protein
VSGDFTGVSSVVAMDLELLTDARYHLALELLANEEMSVDGIAARLGFTSERVFRKAFRRWSGKTPAHARREMGEP